MAEQYVGRLTRCVQCKRETTRDGKTEYYEVRHVYREESNERIEIGGGRSIAIPNVDVAPPDELCGVFCSAKCFNEWVQIHIAPDAAGE
jgi:hypothetical protein